MPIKCKACNEVFEHYDDFIGHDCGMEMPEPHGMSFLTMFTIAFAIIVIGISLSGHIPWVNELLGRAGGN